MGLDPMNLPPNASLVQDQDCHWYLIPSEKRDDWNEFCESDDYGYIDTPDYAKEIDGPHRLLIHEYTILD